MKLFKNCQQALLTLLFCAGGMSALAETDTTQTTSIEQALATLLEANRNIEGEFRQITYDDGGAQVQANEGVFLLAQPNQFVWDTINPFPQRIISDGEWVTIWDVDLEQAVRKPVSSSVGRTPAALLGQPAAEVLPHYQVALLGQHNFRLTPLEQAGLFAGLTLSFRDGTINAMSIVDGLGQTTVIEFKNVEFHEGVAAGNFVVELPANVDLIVEAAN